MCGSPSPHHPMAESRPQPEIAAAASAADRQARAHVDSQRDRGDKNELVRFCSPITTPSAEREGVSIRSVLRTSKRNSFVSTVPSPSPASERDAKLRAVAAHRASESDVPLRGPRKPVERPQPLAAMVIAATPRERIHGPPEGPRGPAGSVPAGPGHLSLEALDRRPGGLEALDPAAWRLSTGGLEALASLRARAGRSRPGQSPPASAISAADSRAIAPATKDRPSGP